MVFHSDGGKDKDNHRHTTVSVQEIVGRNEYGRAGVAGRAEVLQVGGKVLRTEGGVCRPGARFCRPGARQYALQAAATAIDALPAPFK